MYTENFEEDSSVSRLMSEFLLYAEYAKTQRIRGRDCQLFILVSKFRMSERNETFQKFGCQQFLMRIFLTQKKARTKMRENARKV